MAMDKIYDQYWQYLSQTQKDLITEGEIIMNDVIRNNHYHFKDYSFLVFPFAKAYEGFLKQLFKDIGFISHLDYISDHLRLGKLLSPHLIGKLGDRSLYQKISNYADSKLADQIWECWRIGRNRIFHYFPHNLKAISFTKAEELINRLTQMMFTSYKRLYLRN